jgi:hypothetical protein
MDNNNSTQEEDWYTSHIVKEPIWSIYVSFNFTGTFMCLALIYLISKMKDRTTTDIFVANLCSGMAFMSTTCGSQCFANVVHGYFVGGVPFCYIEAYAHVTSIPVQFLSVAAIGLNNMVHLRSGLRHSPISPHDAMKISAGIWAFCAAIVLVFSFISPIYLMQGLYCFYAFASANIVFLLICLGVGIIAMAISHYHIYQMVWKQEQTMNESGHTSALNPEIKKGIAVRGAVFSGILLGCWITAGVATVYEYVSGSAPQEVVKTLGVTGTFHSMISPLVYAWSHKAHRQTLALALCCSCALPVVAASPASSRGSSYTSNDVTKITIHAPTDEEAPVPAPAPAPPPLPLPSIHTTILAV